MICGLNTCKNISGNIVPHRGQEDLIFTQQLDQMHRVDSSSFQTSVILGNVNILTLRRLCA